MPYTFSEESVQRIKRAVLASEANEVGGAVGGKRTAPGLSVCVVKKTGNATGGGKYTGKLLQFGTSDVATTGTLAEADFGTLPTTDNAIILNTAEEGEDSHSLADGIYVGVLRRINADGKHVVAVSPGGGTLPPPTALYQVYQPISYNSTTGTYTLAWDYPRIRP